MNNRDARIGGRKRADLPTRAFRFGVGFLVFLGLWTSVSVYLLPSWLYRWYGEHTFGAALMHHNLHAHAAVVDFLHRLVGVSYLVLALLQFSPRSRRNPRRHRWQGRAFITLGFVLTISGLVMTGQSFGGWVERMANFFFGVLLLAAMVRAVLLARRREFKLHREWMIRAFALSMGVLTLRAYYGIVTHTLPMTAQEALTLCTWLGYCTNAIVAEAWINHTRPRAARSTVSRGELVERPSVRGQGQSDGALATSS